MSACRSGLERQVSPRGKADLSMMCFTKSYGTDCSCRDTIGSEVGQPTSMVMEIEDMSEVDWVYHFALIVRGSTTARCELHRAVLACCGVESLESKHFWGCRLSEWVLSSTPHWLER